MKEKFIVFLLAFLSMAGSIKAQEPRKSSFDDFVFKTPVAYKTGYGNETARILDIYNEGPYTVFKMEDQIRIIADSAYVFVPFNDMLFDPKTHKEYYIISSTGLPKYEREKYYKGREKPYTIKYSLYFNRIPENAGNLVYYTAMDREDRDSFYGSSTFWEIDMSKRREESKDFFQFSFIDIQPATDSSRDYNPLTVARMPMKGNYADKDMVLINMKYTDADCKSKYGGHKYSLPNGISLYDPVKKRKYNLKTLQGLNSSGTNYISGYNIVGFELWFLST